MDGGTAAADHSSNWIKRAQWLDSCGHFADYTERQRREVLRKGFLGSRSPAQILQLVKREVTLGHAFRKPKFNDEMRRHFGLVGDEVREAVLAVLEEIPPESYEPPRTLAEPPGCPFIFESSFLRSRVYFKVQVIGTSKRPQVLLWSCHPPNVS